MSTAAERRALGDAISRVRGELSIAYSVVDDAKKLSGRRADAEALVVGYHAVASGTAAGGRPVDVALASLLEHLVVEVAALRHDVASLDARVAEGSAAAAAAAASAAGAAPAAAAAAGPGGGPSFGSAFAPLLDSGLDPLALKKAGFTLPQLSAAGFGVAECVAAGYSAVPADLCRAGFAIAQIADAGYEVTAATMKLAGFTAVHLREAGFPISALAAAGFEVTAATVRAANYSAAEARASRLFSAADYRAGGWAPDALREAGWSPGDMCASARAGYGGYTEDELKNAGWRGASWERWD